MSTTSIIELKNVSKSYGNNVILSNLNLSIYEGEFLTIIGSSGCGKTTFLKLINGLNKPDSGTVYIEGNDISKEDLISLRRSMGYVIQEIGLFPHMNIRKNIEYIPSLIKKGKNKNEKRVKELIQIVGLQEELLERYPKELSGGQRQRVGIARALALNPKILLMDEPFGAIDEITKKILQEELIKIYKRFNITIIFITHDIKEALKLGTRVLVMDKGEIVQIDTPTEVINNPRNNFVRELVLGV